MDRQRRNRHRDAEESLHAATDLDAPSASPPYPSAVRQRRRNCRTISLRQDSHPASGTISFESVEFRGIGDKCIG